MVLRDAVSKLETFFKDFELYIKVHTSVSVHHKSIILGQMANLNVVSLSIGQNSKFRPSFLLNFGTANRVINMQA